jgi:hypothetical protein
MKQLACYEKKIPAPSGSVLGRFYCICDFIARWKTDLQVFFSRKV